MKPVRIIKSIVENIFVPESLSVLTFNACGFTLVNVLFPSSILGIFRATGSLKILYGNL